MSSQTSMFAPHPKHRVAQATVTVGNQIRERVIQMTSNLASHQIVTQATHLPSLKQITCTVLEISEEQIDVEISPTVLKHVMVFSTQQLYFTLFLWLWLWLCVCMCVCVRMRMYIMSSGSSDIPLHNKSVVRLTKPSLCGCGPGATKGILCLYQTAFSESCVWMVFFMKAQARCEAIWDFWGWAPS